MKKIFALFLSLLIFVSLLPIGAFAKDAKVISGSNAIFVCDGSDSLTIAGKEFKASGDIKFKVSITINDCSSKYSFIYLNGEKLQNLVDGENVIELSTSKLVDGNNEIRISLGAGNATYDDTVVYGTVNADDVTVESVSFEGVSFKEPSSVNYYLPITNQAGFNLVSKEYGSNISVGDGWFADTGLGGSSPNTPVSVGFVFEKPDTSGLYIVDTKEIPDGKYTAEYKSNGKTIQNVEYIIDNTAPEITFSASNGSVITRLDSITYDCKDLTSVKTELRVDGKLHSSISGKKLSEGSHTAFVTAVDEAGNAVSKMLVFEVSSKSYNVTFNEGSVRVSVLGEASLYSGGLLKDIRMFENRLGESDQGYLRSDDEVLVDFNEKAELVTSAIGNSLPYHSFVVNTEGVKEDSVLVSYNGETGNGVGIVLKAWNYQDSRWDIIGKGNSGEAITVSVELEKYSYKKKMRINAVPDIVYNGSDTILWNSDTQYYSRFEDLNEYYYKIANYTVEQYKAGNVGYYVHTGDLVDQTNVSDDITHTEYKVASKAQKILDDALVPNGVVSGNHDISHTTADYQYYWQYFGEDRYNKFDWYGGSLNNNMHHYDLVSIGAYDFVFMYLGNYKEAEADTIAWANAVCQAYPDRNVVICTHEYLLPSGVYSGDRAQIIWDEIIVPNENVIMVLCGHNEGICDQLKQVGNSDRYVLEILADYQFAENGNGPQHVLNNCTCDGEGYVRIMTFSEASQLISTTYSPVSEDYGTDPYNYYPSYADSFVYDLDLIKADRSIKTTSFNVLVDSEYVGEIGDDGLSLKGCEAFYAELKDSDNKYTEVFAIDEYECDYDPDDEREYPEVNAEKVFVSGFANVNGDFRMNEINEIPKLDYLEIGLDLMPKNTNELVKTSGGLIIQKVINEKGGVTVTHEKENGANWVTLSRMVNANVDVSKYNRLYFGVTAGKNAKWNLYVNFQGFELNFSQNKEVASQFGYVNTVPSDITGTWNGYIDLSQFLKGNQTIRSIYLVSATPDETVTFDYLFLGASTGGKVTFITDETTQISYEAKIGDSIALPGDPFKQGYTFDGWYTAAEGGEKVVDSIVTANEVTNLYARFTKNNEVVREVATYNTEINLERPAVGKIIFVCLSLLMMLTVIFVLMWKIKKTGKK